MIVVANGCTDDTARARRDGRSPASGSSRSPKPSKIAALNAGDALRDRAARASTSTRTSRSTPTHCSRSPRRSGRQRSAARRRADAASSTARDSSLAVRQHYRIWARVGLPHERARRFGHLRGQRRRARTLGERSPTSSPTTDSCSSASCSTSGARCATTPSRSSAEGHVAAQSAARRASTWAIDSCPRTVQVAPRARHVEASRLRAALAASRAVALARRSRSTPTDTPSPRLRRAALLQPGLAVGWSSRWNRDETGATHDRSTRRRRRRPPHREPRAQGLARRRP